MALSIQRDFDDFLNSFDNIERFSRPTYEMNPFMLSSIFFGRRKEEFPLWAPISIRNPKQENTVYHNIDMSGYKPSEMSIRTEEDSLIVEAKQENEKEDEYSCRNYVQKFKLPSGVNHENIKCRLLPNNILRIGVPEANKMISTEMEVDQTVKDKKKQAKENNLGEREISIQREESQVPAKQETTNTETMEDDTLIGSLVRRPLLSDRYICWYGALSFVDKTEHLELEVDSQDYQPEDISVKVNDNGVVIVEAKRKNRRDNGYSYSHVKQAYHLPENTDKKNIQSLLTNNGKLKITVPKIKQ